LEVNHRLYSDGRQTTHIVFDILFGKQLTGVWLTVSDKTSPRAVVSQDRPTLHSVEPDNVPGLTPVETVPRVTALPPVYGDDDDVDEGYVENRVITPTMHRQRRKEPSNNVKPVKEFGTQTGK
jgi:hypothetical protein